MINVIVFIIASMAASGFMLYFNSLEEYGRWNVPSLSEVFFYTVLAIVIFPFWTVRFVLIILTNYFNLRDESASLKEYLDKLKEVGK